MKVSAIIVVVLLLGTALAACKLSFVPRPVAIPALSKQWHEQVYSLDEGETVRFIPPPYSPERKTLTSMSQPQLGYVKYGNDQLRAITRLRKPYQQWGELIQGPFSWSGRIGPPETFRDMKAALEFAAIGYWPDVVVPEELNNISADGDWIVRGDTPLGQRMTALQSILQLVTRRDLVIEYRDVERELEGNWSLRLDNHAPLKLIKDRQMELGIVLVERKRQATQQ